MRCSETVIGSRDNFEQICACCSALRIPLLSRILEPPGRCSSEPSSETLQNRGAGNPTADVLLLMAAIGIASCVHVPRRLLILCTCITHYALSCIDSQCPFLDFLWSSRLKPAHRTLEQESPLSQGAEKRRFLFDHRKSSFPCELS
jgi:hypothetical protein